MYYPKANVYRLFDLENDPYETKDLAENQEYSTKLKEMKTALLKLQKQMNDPMLK